MLTQLRIRTLLLVLVAVSISATVALALTGLTSVRLLDRHQDRLTDVALPLLKQNVRVYATVGELTRQLLTVRNASDPTQADTARASMAAIEESYSDLDALVEQLPEAAGALETVKAQFAAFVDSDLELQAARTDLAGIESELGILNQRIEDSVRLSEQTAATISGRTRLATFRQKRALIRQLTRAGASQPLTRSTRATLDDLLTGSAADVPVLATSVQYNVVALAGLSRKLMLATTRDDIVSLRENRMKQTAKRLQSQLDKLMVASADIDRVKDRLILLKAAADGLISLSIGSEGSAFELRLRWVDNYARADAASTASHEAIGALLVGLNELATLAQRTSDEASQSSGEVIATSRTSFVLVSAIVGSLVLFFGVLVRRRVNAAFSNGLDIAERIGDGHLDSDIDTTGSDESADLMRALSRMQEALRNARDESETLINESGRIQQALDSVESCVMVADSEQSIVYMNDSVRAMFQSAEADLRAAAPAFAAHSLPGQSLESLLASFGFGRESVQSLADGKPREVTVGRRTLRCAAGRVLDASGQCIGTVVEWRDRTVEVGIEREVHELVSAAQRGDLDQRVRCDNKDGFFLTLSTGINDLLSATSGVIKDTLRVLGALSSGDLSKTIDGHYEGAFGQLKSDANGTVAKLGNVMSEIDASSQLANQSAEQIRESGIALSERSESQATGLAETASSMAQMTRTVTENAGNAQQANDIAIVALNKAETGGQVVGRAVDAMAGIRGSSTKIVEIIGVIDEIAFQTNLLALNASVEAARAGERGRGFAVVASEVRDLAGRSATAASEIKELIENSVSQVDEGYRLVEASGDTLEEIVGCVKEVTDIVATIADASQDQSRGITQVNEAVARMDKMTRESALMVSRFAEASVALGDQAQRMRQLVGFFSVGKATTGGVTIDNDRGEAAA